MLMVLPTFVWTLALDASDVFLFIIIVVVMFGGIISSIFKSLKDSAAKRKAQTEAQFEMPRIDDAESASAAGPGAAPRTAGERLEQLAEQRRKQLEQIAERRRRQLEDAARRRQGGEPLESLTSLEPLDGAPAAAPPSPIGSAYDREMEQRRRAREEAQRQREQERARQRAAQQQRDRARQRQMQEARRQARPAPPAAPPIAPPVVPPPLLVQPAPAAAASAPRAAAQRRAAAQPALRPEPSPIANTAPNLIEVDAFAMKHAELGAAPVKAAPRAGVPRLDHPVRLRQAFIIKEILDRPLSLRDDPGSAW